MTALAGALQRRAAESLLLGGDAADDGGGEAAVRGSTSSTNGTGSGLVVTVNDFVFDCQLGSVNLLTLLHWVKVSPPSICRSPVCLGQPLISSSCAGWGYIIPPPPPDLFLPLPPPAAAIPSALKGASQSTLPS